MKTENPLHKLEIKEGLSLRDKLIRFDLALDVGRQIIDKVYSEREKQKVKEKQNLMLLRKERKFQK